ncbi:hypothetical protein [Bradyrhizobium tropiciagri]|uniref:hypothetical protein n=1 Tax=Bradyrhizobium tropiciagri TaxID=312253 RepID=UPI000A56549C|nr:hypothetical protein [Bradyrhizobium tropiciagri]
MTMPFGARRDRPVGVKPTAPCGAMPHSFENPPACQSALLGNAINFRAIGRFCNIALEAAKRSLGAPYAMGAAEVERTSCIGVADAMLPA